MKLIFSLALVSSTAFADPATTIHDAATAYKTWTRVDEMPNIAPQLCRQPKGDDFGRSAEVRKTAASTGPHADKLYYLWASEKFAYRELGQKDAQKLPIGFAVVKESFGSKKHDPHSDLPVDRAHTITTPVDAIPAPVTTLETKSGILEIDQPKGLFVMAKVGDIEGADHGWIYGTVSPDGKVTSAGKLATCMGCHVSAKYEDRLFGLAAKN
jgi:hypothetical protein